MKNYTGFQVIGSTGNFRETEKILECNKIDILVVDAFSNSFFNSDSLTYFKNNYKKTKIINISQNFTKHEISLALNLGVKGMLCKSCSEAEIVFAIEQIMEGKIFVCNDSLKTQACGEKAADIIQELCINPEFQQLSPRESEVLMHFISGFNAEEVAKRMFLSLHTVQTHKKKIYKKLQISNASQLVKFALDNKIEPHKNER